MNAALRRSTHLFLVLVALFVSMNAAAQENAPSSSPNERPKFMFVMHGGAGAISRENMTPELEKEYRAKMAEALEAGYRILNANGSGLDAIEAAIRILEDSPLFNAGKGAVFTHDGTNELDSSIMSGLTLAAGAVAGVKHIKNPISLARMVMEKSKHVMLVGDGAGGVREGTRRRARAGKLLPDRAALGGATKRRKKKRRRSRPAKMESAERLARWPWIWQAIWLPEHRPAASRTSASAASVIRQLSARGTYADNDSCAVSGYGRWRIFHPRECRA